MFFLLLILLAASIEGDNYILAIVFFILFLADIKYESKRYELEQKRKRWKRWEK